ncbi:MAG: hypothetical protein WC261_03370 [Synergistaceae bacterium]|jgi:hypothetical protein
MKYKVLHSVWTGKNNLPGSTIEITDEAEAARLKSLGVISDFSESGSLSGLNISPYVLDKLNKAGIADVKALSGKTVGDLVLLGFKRKHAERMLKNVR